MTTTTAAQTTTAPTPLPTRNEGYGFFGTIVLNAAADSAQDRAERAFAHTSAMLMYLPGATPEGVRDFLDSRSGRHLADTVSNHLNRGLDMERAIIAAVAEWAGFTISRQEAHECRRPAGAPFLQSWVGYFAEEAARA